LVILDEPTIGLDPRQSAITRKMMERLRGEITFLLSSHLLSEVEACCDRMVILSHGQIVAEGTLPELQKAYINKTVFEIVALASKIDIQRHVRSIDQSCELIQDEPVEVSGKKRFIFSTDQGEFYAEKVLKHLIKMPEMRVFEFQIERPDLETIFLRATKKNWEKNDLLGKKSRRLRKDDQD
jgi:ABC-2 type transport system ATP-binding protein